MAWLFLLVAGLCEIGWAIGLKYTEGFTRLLPTIGTVVAMAASIGCLGLALKSLPVGTAYAVWTGIGAIGTAALGIYLPHPLRHHRTENHLIGLAARCGSHGRPALKNSSPTCRAAGCRAWRSGRRRQMRHSARTRMELARIPISPSHALFPYDADRR